ncbi:anthranilate synthase component I [Planctomycetales bacterium]|nr:anthranilate synthase component I [Planctomycetales bacterium]
MTTSFDSFESQCLQHNVVPVVRQLLADMHTPVSLLQRFYNGQEGIFLLESVEGGEQWGRFSFLGITPHAFAEITKTDVVIREKDKQTVIGHQGKPLEVLRKLMSRFKISESHEYPLLGGLVGYFAYEMVEFLENIPNQLDGEPYGSFVIPRTILIFDNAKQLLSICVLVYNDGSTETAKQLYDEALTEIERIEKELEKPIVALQPAKNAAGFCSGKKLKLKPALSEEAFSEKAETIKEHIANGDIIQCVFSQKFVSDNAPDAVSLYRALRFSNPAPYLFFMHLGGSVLAGSSPETAVRLNGRTATLRPLAGTRKRGSTEQRDRELADEMLRDPKEKAEHLMLVDLARNDLGRVAKTGSVQVTGLMFVERHPHVMHLVSNITAQIEDGYDGFDLFEATFPAGTLSGAPKVRAMQILAEQETESRGPYGGAAGYISFNGNIDFAITIRTARIKDGKLTAQAGAGIVFDSVPELEYKESINKAMGIAKALESLVNR